MIFNKEAMNPILNFKSFLKFLQKNRLYTFIEVFGLSIAMMFVILIAAYTYQEFSTDNFQEKSERLYILNHQGFQGGEYYAYGFAYKLANKIKDRFPEIESVCPMLNRYKKYPVQYQGNKINADLSFADSSFFNMFSFTLKSGDLHTALVARNYAVISESFANKAFPDIDPMGKVIQVNDSISLTVNGIMKDINNSVVPYSDILARIENIGYFNECMVSDSYDCFGDVVIFILEKKNANLLAKSDELDLYIKNELIRRRELTEEEKTTQNIFLTPIRDVYFSTLKAYYKDFDINQGDRSFVSILMLVGILILLFSIINYVNLAVAQTGFRIKEMATRRLLGSNKDELFLRLIMESTVLCLVSFVLGFLFALAAKPYANELLQTTIHIKELITLPAVLMMFILILIMGFIAGLLPAIIISKANPIDVMKGSFKRKNKMVLSKFFITFQNLITIALVAASITMFTQVNHLINAPLGYNTSNIIDIEVMDLSDKKITLTLANELEQMAIVKRVAYSQGMPFSTGNNYTMTYEGKQIAFQSFVGDPTYFDMLGFTILRENNVGSGDAFYLSQQALKELNLDEDATTFPLTPFYDGPQLIAGVVKDFQLQNIVFEARPTLLRLKKVEDFYPWNLAVEVSGDPVVAMEAVKEVYERITHYEFTGKYIDQQVQESFAQQTRISRIVVLFAAIALLLSFLGLVAMSTYFIQQRYREIAIRKVFGSTNTEMLRKIITTFLSYVVIAFVIVTPLIWLIMQDWLSGYSYRITLSPWIFISSGFLCLLISFITVFYQSYQAANTNPVESIKTE